MEEPDFKTTMLPVGACMELFLKPISRFHALCTKGDMQTSLWYSSLPNAPVSFSGYSFFLPPSLSHAPIYQTGGTCDSKGGAGPVTFGEARDTGMHSV